MASKKGLYVNDVANCEDYKPLPIGFMNAKFEGNVPNPNLPGIKTIKYQRAVSRPVSADVLAVSLAKYGQGNKFVNARAILNGFIKEGKEFKPPKPAIRSAEMEFRELWDLLEANSRIDEVFNFEGYTDFVNQMMGLYNQPNPKFYKMSRGEQILRSTIGTQADDVGNPQSFYESQFFQLPRTDQQRIINNLAKEMRDNGVSPSTYKPANVSQQSLSEMNAGVKNLLRIVYSRGVNLDLDKIFEVGLAGLPPPVTQQQSSGGLLDALGLGMFGVGDPGSSSASAVSQAVTQQGIALPATTSTTREIEKK